MAKQKQNNIALLILQNSAEMAIANQALKQLDYEVRVLKNPASALSVMKRMIPALVLFSNNIENFDPFKLAKAARKVSALNTTALALMMGSGSAGEYFDKAETSGIDAIIEKPFRADHVRRMIVQITSERESETQLPASGLLLICAEPLLRSAIGVYLEKLGISFVQCSSEHEAKLAVKNRSFASSIVTARNISSWDWYDPQTMGTLTVLTDNGNNTPLPESAVIVRRPVAQDKLLPLISHLIDPLHAADEQQTIRLSFGEQALLAARVSASVYEQLLTQSPLTSAHWEDAGELASTETLRICEEFQALLNKRHGG
jgi:CheY-like chemotaxis protein